MLNTGDNVLDETLHSLAATPIVTACDVALSVHTSPFIRSGSFSLVEIFTNPTLNFLS